MATKLWKNLTKPPYFRRVGLPRGAGTAYFRRLGDQALEKPSETRVFYEGLATLGRQNNVFYEGLDTQRRRNSVFYRGVGHQAVGRPGERIVFYEGFATKNAGTP